MVVVVRLIMLLGLLGVVVFEAGCPSPLPELEGDASGSTGGQWGLERNH